MEKKLSYKEELSLVLEEHRKVVQVLDNVFMYLRKHINYLLNDMEFLELEKKPNSKRYIMSLAIAEDFREFYDFVFHQVENDLPEYVKKAMNYFIENI